VVQQLACEVFERTAVSRRWSIDPQWSCCGRNRPFRRHPGGSASFLRSFLQELCVCAWTHDKHHCAAGARRGGPSPDAAGGGEATTPALVLFGSNDRSRSCNKWWVHTPAPARDGGGGGPGGGTWSYLTVSAPPPPPPHRPLTASGAW